MNWKLIAIIAATAVATAFAVVYVLQKQNSKNRMRFDSTEFDDDDFTDDYICGERFVDDEDLDIELPDDIDEGDEAAAEEPVADAAEEEETVPPADEDETV